ncbi:response regulator [Pseudonocardia endophytica]|uniref:LuxR family two component transcriptional regulator n=1 Tax=Pseudonocardia endophytica TaxID=401976 RepID=A0A4R1HS53_PSEEN|nr:response regulator transcription factor [Pseudonocardia endophytica]TCK25008.1 LuxR family two component transcriptional regulator [Pseudonocardia endophytica]
MSGPVRVLVVDDHPIFRDGLAVTLSELAGVRLAGGAASGEEALERVADLRPDVVLMDLRMPGMSGLEATARVVAAHPDVAVVVLTMDADDDSVFAALRAGARGYLLKEDDAEQVRRAVLAVARGEAVFGAGVASRVLGFFAAGAARRPTAFPQLTAREHEVLELLAQGLDNGAIARRLVLSEKSVRNRVSDVLAKLRVRTRAEAVAVARDAGVGG